jgi:hypothetical protein
MHTVNKLLIPIITVASLQVAQAVLVSTPLAGDITTHEGAPASGAPWDNVLKIKRGSGVYIGAGWMLTARHVFASGSASVVYNGTTYNSDSNYILDLQDTFNIDDVPTTGDTDLRLFRLNASIVDLSSLTIGTVAGPPTTGPRPRNGDALTMIGYGGDTIDSRTKSWGTNNVEAVNQGFSILGRPTTMFTTDYDTDTSGEGHAINGDSGGGVFHNNGSEWQIAGLMSAVINTVDPAIGLHIQLSRYEYEINDFILANGSAPTPVPEPSTTALVGLSFIGFILRRSRAKD